MASRSALSLFLAFFALLSIARVLAIDNGLARVPAMGYNTWNDFQCNINAQDIINATDAVIRQGLDKVGYNYVNMDDCWASGRYDNGTIYPDANSFPDGIKAVADYVHSKGLLFGIYTDRGTTTCAGRPASQGYEEIDAQTYADWGVDYLKEDSCNAPTDYPTAYQQYSKMRDSLNATGRPIYFSLCGWNWWYAPVGYALGNSWRIAGDCVDWGSILNAIDTNAPLQPYGYPGNWNDPDMLIGSSSVSHFSVSPLQSRAQFSLWSVMAAPLLIGSNIRDLPPWDLETYSNEEVIAVDQDALGKQGFRISGGNLKQGSDLSTSNVWGRQLENGDIAVAFLNVDPDNAQDITCDITCFAQVLGASVLSNNTWKVRDLWSRTDNGTVSSPITYTASNVPADGGHYLLRFSLSS